jgi:phage terminase large subunit-like protein
VNLEPTRTVKRRRRTAPVEGRNYAAIADKWARDVLAGREIVGALVVKAVERQVREVKRPPMGYAWSKAEADSACELAEELAFPKGPKRGQPFALEPWQVWLVRVIFGWVDAATGLPRFHKVSIWLPKGNGKSPLAAAIGLIILARGRGIGAKVYSAAVAERQARNVFEPAQEMIRLSPRLRDAAGLVVGEHAIKGIGDNRVFECVSSERRSADGTVGDCYIVDEVHQHPTRQLYDVLANNASKVEGSRLVVISTCGTDQSPESIGWLLYCEAKAVVLRDAEAPAHFVFISEADRERDPWDEATWQQANPNYGVSISTRNFRTTAEAAKIDPTAQPHFFATRLGWWWRSAKSWMDLGLWDKAAGMVREEDLAGKTMCVGVDYAPKLDLTGIVRVAVSLLPDGKRQYTVASHGYLPERSPTLNDIPELRRWAEDGWLTLTPGEALDAGYLRPILLGLARARQGTEICLDPFGAVELMASLPSEGIEPVEIRQGWKFHSPAMTEVQVALSQGRLLHDGSPVMRMCMANVVATPDRNGNVVPGRDHDGKKIDLAVALLNAVYRAMLVPVVEYGGPGLSVVSLEDDPKPSPQEDRPWIGTWPPTGEDDDE